MQLTTYTDYALRVLMYLGVESERLVTVQEIAERYGISRNHLMKVVQDLARAGFVESVRGRGGGLRLGRPAEEITLGAVVRHCEDGFALVQCLGEGGGRCVLSPSCRLRGVMGEALEAFLAVLERHTLADLVRRPAELRPLLALA